jgi:hypothetical protein
MGIDADYVFPAAAFEHRQVIDHPGLAVEMNLVKRLGFPEFGLVKGQRVLALRTVGKSPQGIRLGIVDRHADAMNEAALLAHDAVNEVDLCRYRDLLVQFVQQVRVIAFDSHRHIKQLSDIAQSLFPLGMAVTK